MSSAVAEIVKETPTYVPGRFTSENQPANRGRKPGVPSKYSPKSLLATIDQKLQENRGTTFAESLAEGYLNAINDNDTKLRYLYEKAILDKVIADKIAVEVADGETIEDKLAAFHRALNGTPTVQPIIEPTVAATVLPTVLAELRQNTSLA